MGDSGTTLLDAEVFLAFTERLRTIQERIGSGRTDERRRANWQRLLVAATDIAVDDLDRARDKLTLLEAELDRFLGKPA